MPPSSDQPEPATPSTVRVALERTAALLATAGITDPTVDAELLLGHVLGLSRGAVQAAAVRGERHLSPVGHDAVTRSSS